jgi:DnaJ-class molecular chaperone
MRNHYRVLGLDSGADHAEIRAAYRRLAKACHPDVAGADSARQFLEVQEAWQTLGDADRRRAYDVDLAATDRRAPPLPSRNGFDSPDADTLHLDLRLSFLEALLGGELPVELPARSRCDCCQGVGNAHGSVCRACRGCGFRSYLQRWLLYVPAGLADGAAFTTLLPAGDLLHRRLTIHVLIAEAPAKPCGCGTSARV